MIRTIGLAGFGASLVIAAAARAAEPPGEAGFACPAAMAVKQNRAVDAWDWTIGILPGHRRPRPGRHVLSGVSLSEGAPEERGFLAPDGSRKLESGGFINRWRLNPSSLGYWLVCEYETSGAFLDKRLGPEIGQCAVRYGADARVLTGGEAVSCGPP